MAKEIRLAIIWHMHQPDYRDPETGVHLLPWVRLHSLRGYTDLNTVAEEFPHFKQTINFSPVLLSQLAELAVDLDRDHFYQLSKKSVDELEESEKDFLLRHCFLINWDTHVRPHPRYHQLLMKRGTDIEGIDLEYVRARFTRSDYRDLVVLFNLSWCGFTMRSDPVIQALIQKERGYTEEEKLILLELHREALKKVIPVHKDLRTRGILEITCTPEYHPILPLLIDSHVRPDRHPDTPLFRYPEDAWRQIVQGLDIFESILGHRPIGMWPSEGSVSQDAVELIQDAGLRWIATDEALLLDPATGTEVPENADMFRPWLVGKPDGHPLYCCFRNRGLSDDIGFQFSRMEPGEAVERFVGHLEEIVKLAKPKAPPLLVTLVCDGENPWEYYPDGGEGFLRELAQVLENHPSIRPTTPGEYLDEFPKAERVKKLGAGSWIGGNFDIWMGAEEDRTAWKILAEARDHLDEIYPIPDGAEDEIGAQKRLRVLEQLWVAEGSDWFWWYGEPFHSVLDYVFDIIFRNRIKKAYDLMGLEPPVEVLIPVDPKLPIDNVSVEAPLDINEPQIDGKITTFFEWSGAGHLKTSLLEGLVVREKSGPINDIYFNSDTRNIYIRLDIDREELKHDDVLIIRVIRPTEINLAMELIPMPEVNVRCYRADDDHRKCKIEFLNSAAVGEIVEISLPHELLELTPKSTLCFSCFIMRGVEQVDRCPLFGTISLVIPDERYIGSLWLE